MKRLNKLFEIFITFFIIGLTTFGGGYAMISIISDVVCEKKKWISNEELLEICAIAESTPGPIAINLATFVGYKKEKILGSVFATLGVIIPSLTIICLIALVFDKFIENKYVSYAFLGVKACVSFLILKTGLEMFTKQIKKNKEKKLNLIFSSLVTITIVTLMIILEIFQINFSSIYLIIIGGILGLFVFNIGGMKK